MSGSYALSFREAAQTPETAGAKGVLLGRLTSEGFRVPAGFVLAAGACDDFRRSARLEGLIARFTRSHEDPTAELALLDLDRIRLRCLRAPLPEGIRSALLSALTQAGLFGVPLAVRSSMVGLPAHAPAVPGIHRTILNVLGLDALESAVRACWSSLWAPRAVLWRRHAGIPDEDAAMAVIVQRFVPADAAGVTFTRDPHTGEDAVEIRAVWGLGEALTAGRSEPDTFVLVPGGQELRLARCTAGTKSEMARPAAIGGITWQNTPAQLRRRAALTEEQAVALGQTCRRIEAVLGCPAEVEWCLQGERFLILQARPLALAGPACAGDEDRYPGRALRTPGFPATGLAQDPPQAAWPPGPAPWFRSRLLHRACALPPADAGRWVEWNLTPGEVGPSPLTWSLAHWVVERAARDLLARAGGHLPAHIPLTRRTSAGAHLNRGILEWLLTDVAGATPEEVRLCLGGEPSLPAPGPPWRRRWRRLRAWAASFLDVLEAPFARRTIERSLGSLEAVDLSREPDVGLGEICFRTVGLAARLVARRWSHHWWQAAVTARLQSVLEANGVPHPSSLAVALLAAAEGDRGAAMEGLLQRVAGAAAGDPRAQACFAEWSREMGPDPARPGSAWQEALAGTAAGDWFARFLSRFGRFAVGEFELAQPRWSEDPAYPLRCVADILARGGDRAAPGEADAGTWAAVRPSLGPWDRVRCRVLLLAARMGRRSAAATRLLLVRHVAFGRRLALEVGRRMARHGLLEHPGDVFWLHAGEIHAFLLGESLAGDTRALVAQRRQQSATPGGVQHGPGGNSEDVHRDVAISGRPTECDGAAPPVENGGTGAVIAGEGAAPGCAAGTARVLQSPLEAWRLRNGDVLVACATDLAWTLLFPRVSGAVIAGSGPLSDVAAAARAHRMPAVCCPAGSLAAIPDGALVRVDGTRGVVEVQPDSAP